MKSQGNTFEFAAFSSKDLENLVAVRQGETKLGEKIRCIGGASVEEMKQLKYLVLGISEDLGPQSNGGFPGSTRGFAAFLKRFLNVQSNQFLSGESIGILGEVKSLKAFVDLEQGRSAVAELDDFIVEILQPYVEQGLIPIVIGGGHNNAYPLIKSVSKALGKPIDVINFDPHADFRPLEGRHSGNPFSYAFHNGFLERYVIVGLHQSYNSQFILDGLTQYKMQFSFLDDYLSGKADFEKDLERFAISMHENEFGLELDMDSIAYMPSSAFSPSGMSLEQARKYVLKLACSSRVKYLHLPEAAPKNEIEEAVAGKALTYLVTDFIKSRAAAKSGKTA